MTPQQFFKAWGAGIQKITPLQTIKVTLIGSTIVLIGIILGIITTWITHIWWLLIILFGSLVVQGLSLLGSIQKYLTFKRIEEMTREKIEV